MPELSRFFGIIIRMYLEAGAQHHTPHFHAYYQDDSAVFSITPVELIAGNLQRKQKRLVEAWAELHIDELIQDWDLLQSGRLPNPIRPLE
ncbi:MAG: DUF4160 domain-containing protein [Bacteroidota bacterium]|nr:DUF4160 domain-containing protein [Bacteroidota bacterium]MDQ6889380.1 DUF4160 domain-containing protein [Bacteroidota bacterium]